MRPYRKSPDGFRGILASHGGPCTAIETAWATGSYPAGGGRVQAAGWTGSLARQVRRGRRTDLWRAPEGRFPPAAARSVPRRSAGHARSRFFCFWLWEIPLAWGVSRPGGLETTGVFIAMTVSFSALAVVAAALFRRGWWRQAVV